MIRVFLYSDVILDFLLQREPFATAAGAIFARGEAGSLRGVLHLLPVAAEHADTALASNLKDVEDYVQYTVAGAVR